SFVTNGCFVTNKAASKVRQIGSPILSVIEDATKAEVIVNCSADEAEQFRRFPGLAELLVCYFQIVKEFGEMNRAASFIGASRGAVFVESIRAIVMVWDSLIPPIFVGTLRQASQSNAPREREIALWALGTSRQS